MSSRRTAILIGAIAVGVVAVVLIWQYVRNIENTMLEDSLPVPVFIAGQPIARGTAGETALTDKSIDSATVPQKYKPSTAITSEDAVTKKVALFDIAPGTIIVNGMFVDPSTTQISFRERLKNKTHVAISMNVDQVRGVGGFLVPGDEVNMMVMQDNATILGELEAAAGAANALSPDALAAELDKYPHTASSFVQGGGPQWMKLTKTARYLYQKVQILAVGQNQLLSPGEQAVGPDGAPVAAASGGGLLTFNVPSDAAQWIVSMADSGVYLSLVPKDYSPKALPPLPIVVDKLPGEDPAKLCPYFADNECANVG